MSRYKINCYILFLLFLSQPLLAVPITFQGQLSDQGNFANGLYDFQFTLFDSITAGTPIGLPNEIIDTNVIDGYFTVALDFGNNFTSNTSFYLEVQVKNSSGQYIILSPRQKLTPSPLAYKANFSLSSDIAERAVIADEADFAPLAGHAITADSLSNGNLLWSTQGNSLSFNDFLGSTNLQPVDIRVNNLRVFRFSYALDGAAFAPNIIGGASNNFISGNATGSTISGGGKFCNDPLSIVNCQNRIDGSFSTISGGNDNFTQNNFSVISGGKANFSSADYSTISGGTLNTASGIESSIGGGNGNQATGNSSVISGGFSNLSSGIKSTISGGALNLAGGNFSVVAGGENNLATGDYSVILGGKSNAVAAPYSVAAGQGAIINDPSHTGTFVWNSNISNPILTFNSTGPNQFLVHSPGGIGFGVNNPGPNQFLIDADSGVGIGTTTPRTQVHISTIPALTSSPIYAINNHVMLIENPSSLSESNVLAIKGGNSLAGPGNNLITFFDGDETALGAIEASFSGTGVTYKSGSADFAEYLPAGDSNIKSGDIVALKKGKLWLNTTNAERLFVVSTSPLIAGNSKNSNKGSVLVALSGQVPVNLQGQASPGDLMIKSGNHDGKARAVSPDDTIDYSDVIGRVIETSKNGQAKTLVGLPIFNLISKQQQELIKQQMQISKLLKQQQILTAQFKDIQQMGLYSLTHDKKPNDSEPELESD